MTGKEIVERARSLKGYKYWYGGKRELASVRLAYRLKRENPNVWTDKYYREALKDVDGKTRVCDCSGLVCHAYGISDVGSYQLKEKYKVWNGKPLPGMIAWKPGHVGIILDTSGHVIEMRSQKYDYMETRYRKEAGLTTLLYDPNIDYNVSRETSDLGWNRDNNGLWYRHTTGTGPETYYHDCVKIINGHCYAFDSDGYICEIGSYLGRRVPPESDRGWIDG